VRRAQHGQLGHLPNPAGTPIQGLGTGRRIRTPLPTPAQPEEPNVGGRRAQQDQLGRLQGRLQNSATIETLGANPVAQKLKEKAEQFRHLQDFLQNPVPLKLLSKEVDTSSTSEEIEARKEEVRYQIQVMRSVLGVLTDELNELEQARPQESANQTSPTES
jgi:hypothetical protein